MKKLAISVALATMMLFAVSAMAQQDYSAPGSTSPAPSGSYNAPGGNYGYAEQGKMEKFHGKIEGVDQAAQSFTVQKRKETMTFFWNDQTQIKHGKKTLSPMDLKSGERVTVSYREDGGKSMADRIQISRLSRVKAEPKA